MKHFFFVLLCVTCLQSAQAAVAIRGDVNGDGRLSLADVTRLMNLVLTTQGNVPTSYPADANDDGRLTKEDVTMLVDWILKDETHPYELQYNGHPYVDLGLPQKTLWATTNIGAAEPAEAGWYLAWGETAPQVPAIYQWDSYLLGDGTSKGWKNLKRYCVGTTNWGGEGSPDGQLTLLPDDDAAYVNWGANWMTPTTAQFQELYGNCTQSATTINGQACVLFTSRLNGRSILMPAAGYMGYSRVYKMNSEGLYWANTILDNPTYCYDAEDFNFSAHPTTPAPGALVFSINNFRCSGLNVRPVVRGL